MTKIDIKEISVVELKALILDKLDLQAQLQTDIKALRNEIAQRNADEVDDNFN